METTYIFRIELQELTVTLAANQPLPLFLEEKLRQIFERFEEGLSNRSAMVELFPNYKVGDRLALMRDQMGYSQRQLAKCIGVPQSQISNYERHAHKPSIRNARKLAQVFRCDYKIFLA
jgi:DNA-binding XRE family transcriptional regulator